MLISKELLEKAIVNFPKWMDIRKRYANSNGGKLLSSISDTVEGIQDEIDKFIEEFFISYYEDKCDIIPDFIYKANIGSIEISNLSLLEPEYAITTDVSTFYNNENYAYFNNGYLFIKNKLSSIKYRYNDTELYCNTEKHHVWNIYDEFALFINIERYQDETNRELYERIISTANGVINSSLNGLKKSILSSLVNIVPYLSEEAIKLERPTAENLVKYYDSKKTILKRLSEINHDVLKDKIWDKDKWQYNFKQIDYLPNEWDAALDYYKNGIGDNDDLKVELIDVNKPTDATVNFYSRSQDAISEYVRNANIDYNLILKAQRYNNILNELKAEYRITASEIIKLSSDEIENIKFDLFKNVSGKHIRTIDDLIVKENGMNNIYKIRQGELQKEYYYKLKFIPKEYDKPMIISKLYLEKSNGDIINYMIPEGNFILKNQRLYNNKVKAYTNEKSDFLTTINAADTSEGIKTNNISDYTKLEYDLTGLNNNALLVKYECGLTDIYSDDIKCNNFYYDSINKVYKSDTVDDEKNLEINIEANKIYIEMEQGQCNITMLLDGEVVYNGLPYSNNGKVYFETEEYTSPKEMQIIIAAIGDTTVIISSLKFSKYIFNMELENGEFIKENGMLYLPNNYENILKINFRTFTQNSVLLKNIFIGELLTDADEYVSELIHAEEYDNLIIDSTCRVELYKSQHKFDTCSKNNDSITYVEDYKTNNIYVASSNDAYIILNTSEYSEINNIYIENGTYEVIGNNEYKRHIIYLKLGEKISEITIEGTYNELTRELSLRELLNKKVLNFNPYNNENGLEVDEIFINKITKSFILRRSNDENYFNIYYSDFTDYSEDIDIIKILNLPENIESAFVINSSNSNTIINNECSNAFHELYFYPKYSKQYVAINEYTTCLEYVKNVEMLNTFNNGYRDDELMIYIIEPLSDNLSVEFVNGKRWSVGKRNINIKFNIDYLKDDTFNYTQRIISEDIKLQDIVTLNNYYIADNKENIELSQYILLDDSSDYEIIYDFDEENPEYEKAEYIDIYNNNKFNKLRYSNIFNIKYLGPAINDDSESLNAIDKSKYTVINDKGIIAWNDISITNQYNKLYVVYTIKKAVAVKFNMDLLYKKINYNVNAYKKLFSFELKDIYDNTLVSIRFPQVKYTLSDNKKLLEDIAKYYPSSEYIIVDCTNPNFKAEIRNGYIVFNKIKQEKSIAVKNGWYYLNDKEYYLFASNNVRYVNIDNFVELTEVEKSNGNLYFHKKVSNFLNNSRMTIDAFAEVYHINNFKKLKSLQGISSVNELTACQNYNKWLVFGMNLSLKNGVNGLGIYFTSINENVSYAYLEISDYLYDISYISFFCENNLKCYIGINKTSKLVNSEIDIIDSLEYIDEEEDGFKYVRIKKNSEYKYYLVVTGTGLLDDLVIKNYYDANCHKKNIDILGFTINERMLPDTVKRLYIKNSKGNKNNNTEVNSNEFIINSSKIDWNLTKIYKFNKKNDWLDNTILDNVGIKAINDINHVLYTTNDYGTISTKPIYIDDYNIVNKIYFKVNNIPLSKFKNISSQLYLGKTSKDVSLKADMQYKNNSPFNYSSKINLPYFKLVINIPPNKYINDIELFIEYKATDLNYPVEIDYDNGYFISNILDTYEENNYKLHSISIDEESNNFNLYIRGAKEGSKNDVWTDWKQIVLDENFNIKNNVAFYDYRFFQLRVNLSGKNAKAKINYIDLKVV